MRKESITVTIQNDDGEPCDLELEFDGDDFLLIKLDGRSLGIADWTDELRPALERALELWPEAEVELVERSEER